MEEGGGYASELLMIVKVRWEIFNSHRKMGVGGMDNDGQS